MQDSTKLIVGFGALAACVFVYNYFTQAVDEPPTNSEVRPTPPREVVQFIQHKYEPVETVDNVITKKSLVQILKAVQAELAVRLSELKKAYKPLRKENFPDEEAYERLMMKYMRDHEKAQDSALKKILKVSNTNLESFHKAMDRHGSHTEVMSEFFKLKRDSLISFFDDNFVMLSADHTKEALRCAVEALENVKVRRFSTDSFIIMINRLFDTLRVTLKVDEDALVASARAWAKEDREISAEYAKLMSRLEELQCKVSFID